MKSRYQQFKNRVMEHYGKYGRHDLPWRKKQTAYYVVVSEIMLQQTQVDRVVPFFKKWMKLFPSWRALSNASQSEVLRAWKGLGYNSRALRLHKLAKEITEHYHGRLPVDFKTLLTLPGIGPYTAGAVRAFAFNEYTPLIETNIRRVFIHHFFRQQSNVTDAQIFEIMNDMGGIENPREWYAALMDYGSTLPKIIKHNPNQQSKHYIKQSKFEGSDRQIRGVILDILLQQNNISRENLFKTLYQKLPLDTKKNDSWGIEQKRYQQIVNQLEQENFLLQKNKYIILK